MSKAITLLWILGVASLLSACINNIPTLSKAGRLPSPDNRCVALIGVSLNGGYLTLAMRNEHNSSIHEKQLLSDVTGISWLTRTVLIASVSPIYGEPGIYSIDCETMSIKRLVLPHNSNAAYPAGADYFELKQLLHNDVIYYYGEDVDNIDFSHFRTQAFERRYHVQ